MAAVKLSTTASTSLLTARYSKISGIIVMSFTSIPVLDLAMAKSPGTKPQFLDDLRHVLLEVGFLYLKNFGVPDELLTKVIEQGKAFFNIPTEEKYARWM